MMTLIIFTKIKKLVCVFFPLAKKITRCKGSMFTIVTCHMENHTMVLYSSQKLEKKWGGVVRAINLRVFCVGPFADAIQADQVILFQMISNFLFCK